MNILQVLSLGLIQGITEFLPISSSAHLIVIPHLFGWSEHSLTFDIVLHSGTLAAVIIYFGKYWIRLITQGFFSIKKHSFAGRSEGRLFWLIILATVPGVIAGKIFETKAETIFRNPLLIAVTMGGFAILFYIVDREGKKNRTLSEINLFDALLIGASQSLAIIPGVSRSGITIVSGLALKLRREVATSFSFLLSLPIILGATILKIKNIAKEINFSEGLYLLIGFISSAIVGLLSIHYLLNFIKRHNFNLFIIYRIAFCLIIYIFLLWR